jgi:hypothetical protein
MRGHVYSNPLDFEGIAYLKVRFAVVGLHPPRNDIR